MSRSTAQAWRTVLTVLVVCLLQLVGYLYGTAHGWTESAANAFASFCMWSSLAATGQAAKGAVEGLAQGTGLKGAMAALTTDAKPGDPAPTPPPPTEA